MRIVLASASPRRKELVAALVDDFDIVPSEIDEPLGDNAIADALQLARDKASHVARQRPDDLVVAADTIVFDDRELYAKPEDEDDAVAMLEALQGRAHRVVTGIAVGHTGRLHADAAVSTVGMRSLSPEEITAYVATGSPLDKAGGYAIQDDPGVVERLEGCYCNVVGLPLWRLTRLLEEQGVTCRAPDAAYERCRSCPDRPPS